jgi:hypothetical protein
MKRNRKKERKHIEDLKSEYAEKGKVLYRNKHNLNEQIDIGLKLPNGYELQKEIYDGNDQEFAIRLKKGIEGFEVINPYYKYETFPEFSKFMMNLCKEAKSKNLKRLNELEERRNKVIDDINDQNKRIRIRQKQILEELEKLGVDTTTSEFK